MNYLNLDVAKLVLIPIHEQHPSWCFMYFLAVGKSQNITNESDIAS
jgi:hypothetical protein